MAVTRAARATVRATQDGDVLLEICAKLSIRDLLSLLRVSKDVCRVAEDYLRRERNKVVALT